MNSSDEEDEVSGFSGTGATASPGEVAKAELEAFLRLTDVNKKCNALEFWRNQKDKFPLLALVAYSVIGAVGSSAASERDFSMAGNIITKNRSTLLPQHLEMHCLIRANAHLLPKSLYNLLVLSGDDAKRLRQDLCSRGEEHGAGADDDGSRDEED